MEWKCAMSVRCREQPKMAQMLVNFYSVSSTAIKFVPQVFFEVERHKCNVSVFDLRDDAG